MRELSSLAGGEEYGAYDDATGFGEAPKQAFLQSRRYCKNHKCYTLARLSGSAPNPKRLKIRGVALSRSLSA